MLRKILNFFKNIWDWIYLNWDWEEIVIIALSFMALALFLIFIIYIALNIVPFSQSFQEAIKSDPNLTYIIILVTFTYIITLLLAQSKRLIGRQSTQIIKFSEVSSADLIRWSNDIETSMEQIQKAYDWKINQWSSFGKAFLTATLAFISTVIIAILKGKITLESGHDSLNVALGVLSALIIYCITIYQTRQYRREYLAIYKLMKTLS